MFVGGVYARVRKMETEALKGQIWQVPYLAAELLKCYERERVCYHKFRKALTGQVRASRTWRQNVCEGRKLWGVILGKSGHFWGKEAFFEGEESPAGGGKHAKRVWWMVYRIMSLLE